MSWGNSTYLCENDLVDAFNFFIALVFQVLVDVFEVGDEDEFYEVLVLLQVKVFE